MPRLRELARRGYLPESVALVAIGLAVGHTVTSLRALVSADLVLFVLVPGLVFDAAFDIEWRVVRRLVPALIYLAVPGVFVSAIAVAYALHLTVALPLALAFTVGALTAATDPVAVVATLSRLRMPHRLRTLVEGESLLNDGTGLVLAALAIQAATGPFDLADAAARFVTVIVASVAAGIGAGIVGTAVVRVSHAGPVAFALTVALAYGTFALASLAGLSGVLATVSCATTLGTRLRGSWNESIVTRRIDRAWSVVAYALSAMTFFAIGLVIDLPSLADQVGAIAAGTLAVLAARALLVYVPFAVARPRVPFGWAHVLVWSGLRGAVAFAAALSLPLAFPRRLDVQEVTFGIVLMTLVTQALAARAVVQRALPSPSQRD